jgi:hypothetical protein
MAEPLSMLNGGVYRPICHRSSLSDFWFSMRNDHRESVLCGQLGFTAPSENVRSAWRVALIAQHEQPRMMLMTLSCLKAILRYKRASYGEITELQLTHSQAVRPDRMHIENFFSHGSTCIEEI